MNSIDSQIYKIQNALVGYPFKTVKKEKMKHTQASTSDFKKNTKFTFLKGKNQPVSGQKDSCLSIILIGTHCILYKTNRASNKVLSRLYSMKTSSTHS